MFLAILVALSFATVGEAVLIPILDEFRLTKTKLGQTIPGVGILDDVIEVLLLVFITVFLPFLAKNRSSCVVFSFDYTNQLVPIFCLYFFFLF